MVLEPGLFFLREFLSAHLPSAELLDEGLDDGVEGLLVDEDALAAGDAVEASQDLLLDDGLAGGPAAGGEGQHVQQGHHIRSEYLGSKYWG